MARERRTRLERGTVFGVWRLESFVGRGGQADVWTVRHPSERHVPTRAIKVCTATAKKARLRFEKEGKLLQECKHENIVPLLDVDLSWETRGTAPASSFYVMELAQASLDDFSDEARSVIHTLDLFRQACRAITFLHERDSPVLHRDIKPSNLLVAAEGGRLMVTDFGIATEEERQGELTASKEVVGSLVYRAPEVSQGQPASVRSDIFSLGKVLERILTHSVPDQAKPREIPDSVELSDRARQQLDQVIAKATAWDPSHRFGSVKELMEAIPALRVDVHGSTEGEPRATDENVLESMKAFLLNESKEIQLRELVIDETEKLYRRITDLGVFPTRNVDVAGERILDRLETYGKLSRNLMNFLVVGTIFGAGKHTRLWTQALDRILELPSAEGYVFWLNLRYYPGLILYYAGGMGALSESRYDVLNAVLTKPVVHNGDRSALAAADLYPMRVFDHEARTLIPGWERRHTPFNDYIFEVLQSSEISRQVPGARLFDELFDRFEYYRSMIFAHHSDRSWVPTGRYAWKGRGPSWPRIIAEELERYQTGWPPLQGGMFDGNLDRARKANEVVSAHTEKLGWY